MPGRRRWSLHGAALASFAAQYGELPLVGLGPSLSVLALLVALGSLLLATLGRTGPLGLVLVPVAAALAGVAEVAGMRPAAQEMAFRGPWFVLHVVLAMLGYAGLTVAFAAGLMYLLQFRRAEGKALRRRLPLLSPARHAGPHRPAGADGGAAVPDRGAAAGVGVVGALRARP